MPRSLYIVCVCVYMLFIFFLISHETSTTVVNWGNNLGQEFDAIPGRPPPSETKTPRVG